MKRFVIFIALLSLNNLCFGQFQFNNWYFGEKAAVNFTNNKVSNLNDGQIIYNEGNSSISDCRGNLLFYTNSENVYDAKHTILQNGNNLKGSHSSTQGALIVPLPNSCTEFYLFTLDDKENDFKDGLRYSIIDMSGNSGLGAVTTKNNLLYAKSTEKMCATHHANGEDIWLITHEYGNNSFYCYLLTKNGINPVPIISQIGPNIKGKHNAIGQMKASIDGSKVAYVNLQVGAALFEFDKNTGILFNYTKIQQNSGYGIEFSPDGSKLYTTFHPLDYLNVSGAIYQFDLNAGSELAINQSKTLIGQNPPRTDMRALQLGPDGKIYVARSLGKHLGVVNNPNVTGIACNYVDEGFNLNGSICLWSLPQYVSSDIIPKKIINEPAFTFTSQCPGKETQFTNLSNGTDLEYQWSFGDGTLSNQENPAHTYSTSGNYNVTLQSTKKCCTETFSKIVKVEKCEHLYFIPNTFSPNGDGQNDYWKIIGNTIESIEVTIFNRWGQSVFKSNSMLGWDGKLRGKEQPIGSYAYSIKILFDDRERKYESGFITLIR